MSSSSENNLVRVSCAKDLSDLGLSEGKSYVCEALVSERTRTMLLDLKRKLTASRQSFEGQGAGV